MSSIFPLKDIYKTSDSYDYDNFINMTTNQRRANNSLKLNEQSVLTYQYESLNELKKFPTRFNILHNDLLFDFFFVEKNDADKLYLVFSGSKFPKIVPLFKRNTWNAFFDGSVLYVADPMFYLYPNLDLGWYLGNNKINIIQFMCDILNKILKSLKPKKLFSYSSSGGGYAALKIAEKIPHFCIAINPQIFIKDYFFFPEFLKVTGIIEDEDFNKRIKVNFNPDSKYFIIQNETDRNDCINQLFPLLKSKQIMPKYGLSYKDNIFIYIYHALGGHGAQEDANLLQTLLYFANIFSELENVKQNMGKLDTLAISISNIWADLFYYKSRAK